MDTSTANDSLKQEIERLKKQKSELELKLQKWRDYEHVFPADENGNGNEDTEAIINLRKELLFHKNHSIEIEVKNHVLEAEVQTLKKLSEIVASGPKGKGKATENKLRAQLSVMRTEVDNMRLQVGQLQVENERLTEKQLGISPSTDDDDDVEMNTCPPAACSELLKLQENVTELEEQLDELQLIVRSREMNEEKYEIEVQKVKEDMTKSNMVAASKESDLHERIRQLTSDNEDLKLQVDLQKSQIAVNNAHIEKLKHSSSGHSESAPDDVFTDKSHSLEVKLNFERCLKERISHLEKQLQEERKRTRSSLDSKPDVVGETNGAVDQEDDRSPGGRDRERELLKFELNESSMLLEDMRKELEDERERRKLERAEFEKKLAEYFKQSFISQAAEDKKRIERKYIFEKESVELQRKMEGFNWKKEKTDLLRRMEEFKKKAIALQEKLNNKTDTKQSPDELSKQMQDLQHIRKRLESQLAKIDTECWKYKDQADKAINAIQKLTVENEELQASRDILKQERTLLHNKLSTLQVEHRETDLKIRKEREEWDIEKLQYLKQCNESNNADQFKYTQELERLKKEKKNQEFQANEMEIRIEELEKKVFEREQRITSVQGTLRQMEEDWAAERRRLNENFEKELRLRAHENKIDMEEKELEVRCKIREIGELKEKMKDYEKDSSIQLKLIQDLERMQQENEAKWNNERKELINQTRKTDTEKVKSRQAEVVSDGARKASGSKSRQVAWESERSKLVADIKSLSSTLSNKEESWKAERVKYLSDIKDLRLKLRTIEDISEQRNTELCAKLEAATEMSQSLKANENSFKDERQRLMKQIEQKDNLIEEVNKTADTLRATLDSQREELDNTKIEILEKHQREEKLLRTEAAAHKFRLESETKLFREESKYLEDQMQYEIRQRAFYETTSLESKREVGSIKSQLEVLKVELATTKADYEREALIAKRSKQLLEEIQREKREVHGQLTAETQRAEILQKHYVDDKAGWDIMRNELQSKIHRLEQQGKKKLKHDELEARLKGAWDKERIEHRRVISDLHNKTIELRRQVENSAVKWHRERAALQENFGRERKILEDDRQKAESRISELLRKYTVMEESYQRTSEMEARLLQERDLWTVERYDLQKRLQENITSRRLELSRIEALFAEMRRIRSGAGLKSPTTDCGSTITSPMSVHQDLITNGTIVTTNTNETKVKNSASHARSKSVERAPSIGGANRQSKSMGRSYDKVSPSNYCIEISLALEQLAQVKLDLTSFEGQLRDEFAARLKRARSQPDVLDSMVREPMSSPFKSSSLGRPSSRSSDGQRCMRSRSTERPVAEWVCKNEDIPRRRRNRPVLTSPGRFTVKGMLRETDRKSPSLAMDDPRYLGGMMEDSFVRTVRKALEQNQSPSRTTPPLGKTRNRSSCRGQYSDSEITGGGGSDSDSERRFTDPENGYSRPSRTLERPSRFGSGSGLLGQDIRKRSITSPQGSSSPGLSPMRSESRLPSTPPSFLIPKKQSIGSSSGTMSPSQSGMCLIPGLLPKTKSQMQAREQERLHSPNTPTGNGFKSFIGRQSPRDDSRTSSPKSSQSSAHSSPHKVSGNVYTPQHQKTESAQRISSVTTSTRSETTTTVTSQSKTSVTTLPNKSKTKIDVRVKPVQRRTVPIASEEGFDSGSEKSPAPMQTKESPLTKFSNTTASSKSTAKSKLNMQLVPSLTSRFAKPLPANRRPPSRWLRQRTRDDVCSDSEITDGFSSRNRKNGNGSNSRNENRNVVEQFQYPVLNKDERALRLFYKQRHSCETQV
ncbi:trichohyalin-like isoform X2 [Anneissia japonica]|uniref:trichohyalin-like isoform X2 n=1 Tax=Anneissia japonica TaxID=1529436 RepID=UPI0014256778|nr:trichohyalin-like isoform X2 [Anneissia japonica]